MNLREAIGKYRGYGTYGWPYKPWFLKVLGWLAPRRNWARLVVWESGALRPWLGQRCVSDEEKRVIIKQKILQKVAQLRGADKMADDKTLAEARRWLSERMIAGVTCPCCNQRAKVYKRSIYPGMAHGLIALYRLAKKSSEFFHVSNVIAKDIQGLNGGTLAKLRHWGLIEGMPRVQGKPCPGFWRITAFGKSFVEGRQQVRKYAVIYNQKLLKVDGDMVSLSDCLKEPFDYQDTVFGTISPITLTRSALDGSYDPVQP